MLLASGHHSLSFLSMERWKSEHLESRSIEAARTESGTCSVAAREKVEEGAKHSRSRHLPLLKYSVKEDRDWASAIQDPSFSSSFAPGELSCTLR